MKSRPRFSLSLSHYASNYKHLQTLIVIESVYPTVNFFLNSNNHSTIRVIKLLSLKVSCRHHNTTHDHKSLIMFFFGRNSSDLEHHREGRSKRGVINLYSMIKCATGCDPLIYKGNQTFVCLNLTEEFYMMIYRLWMLLWISWQWTCVGWHRSLL